MLMGHTIKILLKQIRFIKGWSTDESGEVYSYLDREQTDRGE